MRKRLKFAVIGCGSMGTYHAKKICEHPGSELLFLCDTDIAKAHLLAGKCPSGEARDGLDVLSKETIDAAIIATPATTHAAIAEELLSRGISLLVEKPLAPTVDICERLIHIARSQGVVCQIGHVERYNPLLAEIHRSFKESELIEMDRGSLFSERGTDVSVIFDLMIHDLDILNLFAELRSADVRACGTRIFSNTIDIAKAQLRLPSGQQVLLRSSRVDVAAGRKIRMYQMGRILEYDLRELSVSESKRRLSSNPEVSSCPVLNEKQMRLSETDILSFDALRSQLDDFVTAVQSGSLPRVSLEDGTEAVRIAQRIEDIVLGKVLGTTRSHPWSSIQEAV